MMSMKLLLLLMVMNTTTLVGVNEFAEGLAVTGVALASPAIMWGAIKLMFSGGNKNIIVEGKNNIKNSIIGLIIVLVASCLSMLFSSIYVEPLILIPVR